MTASPTAIGLAVGRYTIRAEYGKHEGKSAVIVFENQLRGMDVRTTCYQITGRESLQALHRAVSYALTGPGGLPAADQTGYGCFYSIIGPDEEHGQ